MNIAVLLLTSFWIRCILIRIGFCSLINNSSNPKLLEPFLAVKEEHVFRTLGKIISLAIILSVILFFICKRKNHAPQVPLTPLGPAIQWIDTLSDSAIGDWVQQTNDKGFIIAGFKEKSYANNDFYLLKTDSLGKSQWEKTFGGPDQEDANSLQLTRDGGYIIAGTVHDSGSMMYLIKTDSLGNQLWEFKKYSGTWALGVQQTNDAGYITAGRTHAAGSIYIMKMDSTGTEKWMKVFSEQYKSWIAFIPVQQTSDRGYIIGAEALIKADSLGNIQWRKAYNRVYVIFSVQPTFDHGYIATGIGGNEVNPRQWNDIEFKICLIKTDSSGNLKWRKTFGKGDGRCVSLTQDGGYIISGTTESYGVDDGYIIKTDS
jgi:hypothetical protein